LLNILLISGPEIQSKIFSLRFFLLSLIGTLFLTNVQSQDHKPDSLPLHPQPFPSDSILRITNLNPYFTIHVDSLLNYDLRINKNPENYYWYLKQAPVGVRLDRSTGTLFFKADKSFFRSGKLRYDLPYRVDFGVQSLSNPLDKVDTFVTIMFYSTEISPSRVKPGVLGTLYVEEGDTIRFRIQCETGTFPLEQINFNSNIPVSPIFPIRKCDDEFFWMVPYDFIRENDTTKQRMLLLQFIGSDKFFNKDTAAISIAIRPGINYPQKYLEHKKVSDEMKAYIQNLKLTFYVLSKSIKANKSTRTAFDITGSSTALAGTILATTASNPDVQDIGKILPSIGLTLVPVKEAVAPNKVQEQNTAAQLRGLTKRLEYLVSDNALIGDRDPEVLDKTRKLREELKQAQLQLIDLPAVELDVNLSQEEADKYFNDPKVIKKYKLKVN